MTSPDPPQKCFLTEWYQPALARRGIDDVVAALGEAATHLHHQGHPIRLLVAVNAPTDQVLYSVFAAESADAVTQACLRAGCPADRITSGIQTRIP
ncbi:MAG TPA: hypothetical protein VFC01_18460 [Mycobacterium sp.]|nr:hypothetical protein [Mycobacterium sp.]